MAVGGLSAGPCPFRSPRPPPGTEDSSRAPGFVLCPEVPGSVLATEPGAKKGAQGTCGQGIRADMKIARLDDCTLQLSHNGTYLDLEATLAEQRDELEGFQDDAGRGKKHSIILRTQLSVRVHACIAPTNGGKTREGCKVHHSVVNMPVPNAVIVGERAAQGAWAWGMGAGVGEGHVGAKDGLTKPLSPSPGIGFKATGKLYRVPWSTVHLIRKP
ncbi:hypothetical protein CB1_000669015 [Camelus ferus]|nr:hypothetical protein CB1_000669015 [Camelus ferus]